MPCPCRWSCSPPPLAKAAPLLAPGLDAPYPNPFDAELVLQYQVPVSPPHSLVITNGLGQPVRSLYSGTAAPGTHRQVWDGRD